jgi:predicted Zn finger-like uncharacterized protein
MLITCPNCEAGYDVPDHLLAGAGRKLRCAGCAQEWRATLPEPEAPTPAPTVEQPEAVAPPEPTPPTIAPLAKRRNRLPWIAASGAWAASLAILALMGWSAIHFRGDIVAAWPPSERVFLAVARG